MFHRTITLRTSRAVHDAAKAAARGLGVSLNLWIEDAVIDRLDRECHRTPRYGPSPVAVSREAIMAYECWLQKTVEMAQMSAVPGILGQPITATLRAEAGQAPEALTYLTFWDDPREKAAR